MNRIFTGQVAQLFIVTIFMFISILSPRIGIADLSVVFLLLSGLFAFVCVIKNRKSFSLLLHEKFFLYLLTYALIIFLLEGSLNVVEYGQYFFRVLRSVLFYSFLVLLFYQFKISVKTIVLSFVSVLCINLVITYFQCFDLFGLREFFVQLNTLVPKELNLDEYSNMVMKGVRSRGLLKGFDVNSIAISSLLFFALFFSSNKLIHFFAILLTIIGTFFTARIGIVAALMTIFFFIVHILIKRPKKIIGFAGVVFFALALLFLVIPSLPSGVAKRLSIFTDELGHFGLPMPRIESLNDTIENHLTLRNIDSPRIYLFGKASKQHTTFSRNVLSSDVGYIQILYNFGILNLLLLVLLHLWIIYEARKEGNPYYLIYGYAVFIFFVLAIKGPYFFSKTIYDLIVLLFFHHAVFLRGKKVTLSLQNNK